jgi:membrane protease YdiL (CAAX protease family)
LTYRKFPSVKGKVLFIPVIKNIYMNKKQISPMRAVAVFTVFTAYFFLLLFTLFPFLQSAFTVNPALYWFVTGYCLFIPLFAFAVIMVRREGARRLGETAAALCIKSFSRRDWIYSITGLLLVFLLTGAIMGLSMVLNKYFGIRALTTTPWFMQMRPFGGIEKLLLLVWLPMFFFNIVGEEILWRGYIQSRLGGPWSWLICSFLWFLFHLPFGFDLMVILAPVMIIIPYVFHKTGNSMTGIFIHGVYNGPMFIMVSLGFL